VCPSGRWLLRLVSLLHLLSRLLGPLQQLVLHLLLPLAVVAAVAGPVGAWLLRLQPLAEGAVVGADVGQCLLLFP